VVAQRRNEKRVSEDETSDRISEAEEIDTELEETYAELLDVNQSIVRRTRDQIKAVLEIRDLFLEQAARCEEIARLHVRGAELVGVAIGDLIAAEWGLMEDPDELDPDEIDEAES
jgi:hypothetical protein